MSTGAQSTIFVIYRVVTAPNGLFVIYQLKNTVSQITCHAATRVQRIGFSHKLAWQRICSILGQVGLLYPFNVLKVCATFFVCFSEAGFEAVDVPVFI